MSNTKTDATEFLLTRRNGDDKAITEVLSTEGWVFKMIVCTMQEYAEAVISDMNKYNSPALTGWVCPRCGKVHSPFVLQCDCPPPMIYSTGATTETEGGE